MDRIEYPFTENLKPHPLHEKIYGHEEPDQKLVDSIREMGIRQPLLINGERQIISGHRRWAAAMQLKLEKVPVIYFKGSDLEAERLIIESNRQREKTFEQKEREYIELKIESELAAQRMKAGKKIDPATDSVGGSRGEAAAKAAKTVGLGRDTAKMGEDIVKAADAGDKQAREELDAVNARKKSVAAAHKEVTEHQQSKPKCNSDSIVRNEKIAAEIARRFSACGVKATVHRASKDGQFHVNFHDMSELDAWRLLDFFESPAPTDQEPIRIPSVDTLLGGSFDDQTRTEPLDAPTGI